MKDEVSNIPVNMKTREVLLGDDCLKALDLCKAFCCSYFDYIEVSEEEYLSGKYRAHPVCTYNRGNPCVDPDIPCPYRKYALDRKEDGSCVYLDDRKMCSIHEEKPSSCRNFNCGGAWRIHYDRGGGLRSEPQQYKLDGEMVFRPNPNARLAGLICSEKRKQLIISKKMVDRCGVVTNVRELDFPGLGENEFRSFFGLFDGSKNLKDIYSSFEPENGSGMTVKDKDDLVRMLLDEGLINFKRPDWDD